MQEVQVQSPVRELDLARDNKDPCATTKFSTVR